MLYLGVEQYYSDEEMEGWTSTSGTVTGTEVRIEYYSGKGAHYEYYPDIQYYYSTGDEVYYAKATAPIDGYYGSYAGAQSYLDHYPSDSSITVYYDPNDPSDSVLDRDHFDINDLLVAFLPLTIGALGLTYFVYRYR